MSEKQPAPLLARLRCLAVLLQKLNAQTACEAVNEAVEALEGVDTPVAEIGPEWSLRFVGAEPIAQVIQRAGLGIGTKLYTHPQPVTPAGGEVEPVAEIGRLWSLVYVGSDPLADVVKRHRLAIGTKLYTHPPVADAALPRGHSISDAKQALGVDESLNIEALRGLLSIYEKCPATGQREVIALKAAIAALNQRGGGDHG